MATDTPIEWTHFPGYKGKSWNPVTGCTKIAAGCKHCYAETLAKRFWKDRAFTDVQTHADRLDEPLRRRLKTCYFVNSMSDLFHEDVPFEFIAAVYGVMAACPQHLFIILTKRSERMREFFEAFHDGDYRRNHAWWLNAAGRQLPDASRFGWRAQADMARNPLPNVIHGYSAANQADLDAGVADLLATPSALRCLSLEPLIGPVELTNLKRTTQVHMKLDIAGALANKGFHGFTENGKPLHPEKVEAELRARHEAGEKFFPMGDCPEFSTQAGCPGHRQPSIHWVIVGGESGPGARPCDVAWIRSIVSQCNAAGVACFVKQLGALPVEGPDGEPRPIGDGRAQAVMVSGKGGKPEDWPQDLRVREFPEVK